MTTREHILSHCARYPLLQCEDLLKFLHQSTFGPGHLIREDFDGEAFLRRESQGRSGGEAEALDGDFFRLPLGGEFACDTLWRCFVLSASMPTGTADDLERRLACALQLAQEGLLPFSAAELSTAAENWRKNGFPARHHSSAFRAAYDPAYRVMHKSFLPLLPLLQAVDQKRGGITPLLIAIDGGAGSGKSTLGAQLRSIYRCPLLHMDDFFLRPHQRTPQRLALAGGNVDRERFEEEVLRPCRAGLPIAYRRYDCGTQTLLPPQEISPAPLVIVEGSYSCHPALRPYYDLTVYLDISPALQRRRIERRNSPEMQQRFFDIWIPMEQRYFEAFSIPQLCDLVLEVSE